ncbi:hypothetical protein REPUB_Repub07fG0100100 [Reevesia pubescens]
MSLTRQSVHRSRATSDSARLEKWLSVCHLLVQHHYSRDTHLVTWTVAGWALVGSNRQSLMDSWLPIHNKKNWDQFTHAGKRQMSCVEHWRRKRTIHVLPQKWQMLFYHAMVLLRRKDVKIENVLEVPRQRFSQSGVEEKQSLVTAES